MEPRSINPLVGILLVALVAAAGSTLGWLVDGLLGVRNILAALAAAGLAGIIVHRIPLRF